MFRKLRTANARPLALLAAALLLASGIGCQSSADRAATSAPTAPAFTRIIEGPHATDSSYSFGVAWTDYDLDGFPDLFVTAWHWEGGPHLNRLYHNDGKGGFTEVAETILSQEGGSLGATWGDYDNDGDPDLFVANPGHPRSGGAVNYLYRNDGEGAFGKLAEGPVVSDRGFNTHCCFVDFDCDGDLDLSVATHARADTLGAFFYRNDGATFVRLDLAAIGIAREDMGTLMWADADSDGYPDFVTARNDLTSRFYVNNGDGTFSSVENAVSTDTTRTFCWGDCDNDGDLDLIGGGTWYGGLILYRNDGSASFTREPVDPADTAASTTRKPHLIDYDNDGDLDLFLATMGPRYEPRPNVLYENDGIGAFHRREAGALTTDRQSAAGAAWADYDRDGDLDLYLAENNAGGNAFYRNYGNRNNWICIACRGTRSNRSGIGARVRAKARIGGKDVWQLRELSAQSGFFGQNEMRAHFGLGDATVVDSLTVFWPGGSTQTLTDVAPNQYLTITEE